MSSENVLNMINKSELSKMILMDMHFTFYVTFDPNSDGYYIQINKFHNKSEQVFYLSDSRGNLKIFSSLDTVNRFFINNFICRYYTVFHTFEHDI